MLLVGYWFRGFCVISVYVKLYCDFGKNIFIVGDLFFYFF